MSSSDLAISVRGLSKSYTIRHQHENEITLTEQMMAFARHPLRRAERETFWALDDVSFDVHKGEVLGIIGRNGAGKSTLLKVLSRVTVPTRGEVRLYGRVGSLLEVGTGFHPELTGRENVYLNGSILGMRRKEIDQQFDAIVEFAGVEKFLDTPVKRYSSGMYVRLAFAVAAHLETEILIIDEVLAVGDAEFQKKCIGKIGEVTRGGRTAIFVSHNLGSIAALCPVALLLERGQALCHDSVSTVVSRYEELRAIPSATSVDFGAMPHYGDDRRARSAEILELRFLSGSAIQAEGEPLILELEVRSNNRQPLSFGVGVYAMDDTPVSFGFSDEVVLEETSVQVVRLTLPTKGLVPGDYHLSVSIGPGNSLVGSITPIDGVAQAATLRITASPNGTQRWIRHWGWHRVAVKACTVSVRPDT